MERNLVPRTLTLSLVIVLVALANSPSRAQDLEPTTEFGLTITPNHLYDAIQETQDFWPPVRAHLSGDSFVVADLETRQQAADFIGKVNDHLHDRLFGDDEATAIDLMDYLAARLRVFELYRQLRAAVSNDSAMTELKTRWERRLREINELPEAERAAQHDELIAYIGTEMESLGLPAERRTAALKVWQVQVQAIARMNTTGAGRQMLVFEQQVKHSEPALADLIRLVVATADWAQITKTKTTSLLREDFIEAWHELAQYEAARTANNPANTTR